MKKYNFALLLAYSALLFFVSCSTAQKEEKATKQYSNNTQKEFESIEKGEVKFKTPNRPARQQTPALKPAPQIKELNKETIKETPKPIVKETPKQESTELVTSSQLNAKNQERLQEINQNLAFFCMKHRNDHMFSSEENCLKFTKKVLNDCEKTHKIINTVMVNCIKDRLRKQKR